jgi:hypothetical protein
MAYQQFFYDKQIRRYITQFIRLVSNFQVEFGKDRNGTIALQRVPVIYGDSSRQAAAIIRNNSENSINAVPAMAVYINGLEYDRSRVMNPTYVDKMQIRERYYDTETGQYGTTQGDTYTVERLMPVPYKLTLKLDIWTSNTEQKLQILEQLTTLFNPALEIQSTDNYVDWTSITYVLLSAVNWTSRTVPVGSDTSIDIATLTFELPMFISPPALIKSMGVVQKIIASVFDANGNIDEAIYDEGNLLSRQYITPMQYGVILVNNELRLVKYSDPVDDQLGTQLVKEFAANVTANANVTLVDADGITSGMIITGLNQRGVGSITATTTSNVVTGSGTSFSTDMYAGTIMYTDSDTELGIVSSIDSATQVTLVSNATANLMANSYNFMNNVTSPNTSVISVNGQTVLADDLVTGNIGDRIVFTAVTSETGISENWRDVVNVYGNLVNGTSQVRLELASGAEIVGTVSYNPLDPTVLIYSPDIDTLPANNLDPINAIVDPQSSRPLRDLQKLANGTRYLLVNNYVSPTSGFANAATYNWQGIDGTRLVANANDIIQYNGSHWYVAFQSNDMPDTYHITNMTTGIQYVWNGITWAKSYEGFYEAGKWQLVI